MGFEFETKMFRLAAERKRLLEDGEKLFMAERVALGVEHYFEISLLCDPETRISAKAALETYAKQLSVERNFYSEFHRTFVEDIEELAGDLLPDERERVLARSLGGLEENDLIRMKINEEKSLITAKVKRVIEIFDVNNISSPSVDGAIFMESDEDIAETERLIDEIDAHLENQANLSAIQRKRWVDGQKFIERLLNFFRNE